MRDQISALLTGSTLLHSLAAFSAERWRLFFDIAGLRKQGKEGNGVRRPNEGGSEAGDASKTCFVRSSLLVPPPNVSWVGIDQIGAQRKLPSETDLITS